jgi:outer membrane protein assembly factor BamB
MSRCARLVSATLVALSILLALPVAAFAASAWPVFGHDAAHSRRSQYVGAQTATVKWVNALTTSGWIESSPALAADGTVYVTPTDFNAAGQDQLYALKPSTGEVSWHSDVGEYPASPGVDDDGYIYVGGELLSAPTNQRGKVFAFSPGGGSALWTFSTWSRFDSSPTCAGGAIYVGCEDGNLYSLSPLGEHLNWGAPINGSRAVESSPAVDGAGAVYVGASGKMMSVTSTSPGTTRWSVPTSGSAEAEASPAISADGKTVYFADDGGAVYALATVDGVVKWTHTGLGVVPPARLASSPGIGADGTVYIGGGDGSVYALNSTDGSVKWSFATGGAVYSSPAIGADGTVYVGSSDGSVYALNGSHGDLKWSYATGAQVWSSPAIGADGTVYVGNEAGKLYAFGGGSAPAACSLSTPATSGALKRTVSVKYSGKLTPARAAKVTLTFQKKSGGKWKTVASPAVTTKATGAWTYKKKLAAGTYHVRAATAATAAFKSATSKWKAFTIK